MKKQGASCYPALAQCGTTAGTYPVSITDAANGYKGTTTAVATTVQLHFKGKQAPVETNIFLLDAAGRLVLEHKAGLDGDVQMDLSAVPAGTYQLLFVSEAGSIVEPLVVQKL